MLTIESLTKSFGATPVLRGVDLQVSAGEILGLIGANGAGKTTMISIACGLRPATSGRVSVAGIDALRHPRQAQAHIGLAPQNLGIYPTLSVRDNIRMFASLAGLKRAGARRRTVEVAEALGLSEKLGDVADTLSGGQKRRLHTALAIVRRPDLLFLDEPTVGADVQSRAGILSVVRELAGAGTAVVYTTHYLTELEQLDARIAILEGGRIIERGSIAQILARHATNRLTLSFDQEAPALPGWHAHANTLVMSSCDDAPSAVLARALAALGPNAEMLRGVDIAKPSLETAYLHVTGHSLEENDRVDAA
jgi:ABC-2 type transport system ATP-binding protein